MPTPPEIVGQLPQAGDPFGQMGKTIPVIVHGSFPLYKKVVKRLEFDSQANFPKK